MGAVNIDNTGSGASVTLSSDGTDLLLNGSPIGGGGGGSSTLTIQNKTGAYTVVAGDLGTIINCTSGTFTVALDAAATLGSGFNCWVWNTSTTTSHAITIDPNGSETIDEQATLILWRGEGIQIICNGTNWETGDKKTMRGYAENLRGSNTRPVASGSAAISIGWSSTASGSQSTAIGYSALVSSTNSTAIGTNSGGNGSQVVTGSGAMSLGGSYASGTDSFAAAIANNTSSYGATGANSVAIGRQARATTSYAVALGASASGLGAVSSGSGSVALGGSYASGQDSFAAANGDVSGTYGAQGADSVALGDRAKATATSSFAFGILSVADAVDSMAFGNRSATNGIVGKYAFGAGSANYLNGLLILRNQTADATPTVLTSQATAASTTNQIILPNNSAYAFTGIVVARQQASGGTASAAWKIEGLIRREGSAGTTTLVNSALTVLSNVPGWTLALSADTTNGGLAITATGAAATNIRWVATVQTSEVTYA